MNIATPLPRALQISACGSFPSGGVDWLEVPYDGTSLDYRHAPHAVSFNGIVYGKASHNSDTFRITYRTDALFGLKVTP